MPKKPKTTQQRATHTVRARRAASPLRRRRTITLPHSLITPDWTHCMTNLRLLRSIDGVDSMCVCGPYRGPAPPLVAERRGAAKLGALRGGIRAKSRAEPGLWLAGWAWPSDPHALARHAATPTHASASPATHAYAVLMLMLLMLMRRAHTCTVCEASARLCRQRAQPRRVAPLWGHCYPPRA